MRSQIGPIQPINGFTTEKPPQRESNRQTQKLMHEIDAHQATDFALQQAKELAERANASHFFVPRAQQCQSESGRLPNFVTVDFYATGDLFAAVAALNGL